ncbi:penicillin-binding protein 2 [Alkalithermobacter thermoalcaliphilus JW-YL-7 = DSM 7308]|uniref:Penicillin-binding protein 2 n=1 Tax=Alkalithermobacter thermoalcaliphilus JW-YL-7 = DSM 7308 TaxID=1121328 RepID=A0A150FPX3_CLOPD|nr:Peptidoglycan glycosyltransferase [[Clostridium] paradoxum JW-YL-7 = DSM 7308]SHK65299.1 penicillin-binding protein 2 [[Clostridium] paradoxum JW-YL-7 = DSM 7308]
MYIKLDKLMMKRLYTLFYLFIFIYISITGKLAYIQIYKGREYYNRTVRQSEIKVDLTSNRGIIYDRNGIPLTDVDKEKVLVVLKNRLISNNEKVILDTQTLNLIKSITKMSEAQIYTNLQKSSDIIEFKINNLDDDLERQIKNKRGMLIVEKTFRYSKDNILSHVIGYINEYDNVGVSGIEKAKDNYLKYNERQYVEVFLDAHSNVIPGSFRENREDNKNAKHIKTTIDYNIQRVVEEVMDKNRINGAVVVSNVKTGEILAMASRPNFDVYKIGDYVKSSGDELLNKAIQCTYPPGSVFKTIVALAAFEEGVVKEDEIFNCQGDIQVDGLTVRCWKEGGHGEQTFAEAFYNSCNTTFIEIGKRVGSEKILEMAKRMGLYEKVGIGLSEEKAGIMPKGDKAKGNAITNISIGQGDIEVTPLQVNQMTQIIANNGVYKRLYLFDSVLNQRMNEIEKFNKDKEKVIISPFIVNRVRDLMEGVVIQGTGRTAQGLEGESAGKTGSAESYIRGKKIVHGWFTGYHPFIDPKYAITVFVYDGKSGGGAAAPIFKEIIENINNN